MKAFAACLAAALAAALPSVAQAWFAEDGQGVHSAGTQQGGNVFYVNCVVTAANVVHSVGASVAGVPLAGTATLVFDNARALSVPFANGGFGADSPYNQQLFALLVGQLAVSTTLQVQAPGIAAAFSLQGAAQALQGCPMTAAQAAPPENPVLKLETYLARLGFNPGAVDGSADAQTNAAIAAYQRARGLTVTGGMTTDDLRALEAEALAAAPPPAAATTAPRQAVTVKRVIPPRSAEDITYFRLGACAHERGLGLVGYLQDRPQPPLWAFTDLCLNRTAGTLESLEPARNLTLVRDVEGTQFYEVIVPGTEANERDQMTVGHYAEGDPESQSGESVRAGAVRVDYETHRRHPAHFPGTYGYGVGGFVYETSFGPDKTAGPFVVHVSGGDAFVYGAPGGPKRTDSERPYIGFEGTMRFDGASGTASLRDTGEGNGTGSGTLSLTIGADGAITGSGGFSLQNGRLAGVNPDDWKSTDWRIVRLHGHTTGDDGQEFHAIAIATGETLDHDGVRTPVYGGLTIVGYGPKWATD